MNDCISVLINIILVATTVWIINGYLNFIFEKKENSFFLGFLWIIFCIFQIAVELKRGDASIWYLIFSIIFVTLIALLGFYSTINRKIFFVIAYFVVQMLVEMFLFKILMVLPVGKMEFGLLGSVCTKLILIVMVNILGFKFYLKENYCIPIIYNLMLLVVPVGSIFIAHNIFILDGSTIGTIISFCILLVINIVIFEIYMKLLLSFMIEKENVVYKQQVELLVRNIDEKKRMMDDFHEKKHNFINQLVMFRNGLNQGRIQETIQSLDKLIQNSTQNQISICNSGNDIIDAFINYKYSIAKQREIEFKLKINIPDEIIMMQSDLGVILGNALDNAIDSTMQCNDKEKIIHIFMGLKKESLILVIKNPYEHLLKYDNNKRFFTTKKNHKQHGYGLSSIKKTVEKHQGEVIIDTTDNIFTLTIYMNM